MADDISALDDIVVVSRETAERLEAFVALLRKWQPAENLVSAKTLPEIWRRHVADSAQLVPLFPGTKRWIDLGTGAGFPGLIVALTGMSEGISHVDLIEANQRKCAFLRAAIRETGAPATVHTARAEDVLAGPLSPPVAPSDRVIGRAVAPLAKMLELAWPVLAQGASAAFHKGADYQREVAEAQMAWTFDLTVHPSRIGGGGVILAVDGLRPRESA